MAGHIQERGNGSYLLVYHVGYDADGKRIRKTRTVQAKNKTEADKKLSAFVTEVEQGEYVAPSHSKFADFVRIWLKEQKKDLAPNTIETYNYFLDARILPAFSHLTIEKVKPAYLRDYMDKLEEEGLSPATQLKHHNILNGIFNKAKTDDLIKHNPMDKVKKPKRGSTRTERDQVFDSDELKQVFQLLNQEENKQMALMIKMALKTGMRKGELLGLQWDDVNVADNIIHVRHSLSYTKADGYRLKDTKTEGSARDIAPPSKLMKELQKHISRKREEKAATAELWDNTFGELVFSTYGLNKDNKKTIFGKALHRDSPNRWWRRFLKRHNLKQIRFHDLRHTAATDLINRDFNLHAISNRLGHKNIKMTANVYGHHLNEADQKIADMLDEDYI